MICSIHQPQSFPWLGYFAKIIQSDVFIFLDDVQFKKNEWQNRNKVKCGDIWQWLTVPVKHNFGQTIKETEINNNINWNRKNLQKLRTCYGKAQYFNLYFPEIENLFNSGWKYLSDFNIAFIKWIMDRLKISTATLKSSNVKELKNRPDVTADERLIALTKATKSDTYLSGVGGNNYLKVDLFPQNGIRLKFQEFQHPDYSQMNDQFISHLSILDLLLNEGDESLNIIKRGIR